MAQDSNLAKCICGNQLILTSANIYGVNEIAYCNKCAQESTIIYHCSKLKIATHKNGYDLCPSCCEINSTQQKNPIDTFVNDDIKQKENNFWNCRSCTFQNQMNIHLCAVCGTKRSDIESLLAMGFPADKATIAMQRSNNKLQLAIHNLTNNKLKPSTVSNKGFVCTGAISKCKSFRRLLCVLKEYHIFVSSKAQKKVKNIYYGNLLKILDDFNHLLQMHSDQYQNICKRLMISCNNNKVCLFCHMSERNHRDRALQMNRNKLKDLYFIADRPYDVVFQQILDTIHCYYFHKISAVDRIDNKDSNDNEAECKNASKFTTIFTLSNPDIKYKFGWRFFYWPFYMKNHETVDPAVEQYMHKLNANEGYSLCELYVKAKYKNFKDEMTDKIDLSQWQVETIKAKYRVKTEYLRRKICDIKDCEKIYNLQQDTIITVPHLVSLMIYCNYDELQRNFSETFRQKESNETLQSLLKRHTKYAYLGRLLRECVECFGYAQNEKGFEYCMKSLYHGITIRSQFESLFAFIKGPVSTTTDYSIAVNFSGPGGMILEFQIDNWYLDKLRLFECWYISDFPNEQEVLFIGGYHQLSFQTIIDVSRGSLNYQFYVKPLTDLSNFCGASHAINQYDRDINIPGLYKATDPIVKTINNVLKKNVTTGNEVYKKLCFRILSHQLYNYYGGNKGKQYFEFKGMPNYAKNLAKAQFASIEFIYLFDFSKDNIWRCLFEKWFIDNDGWIKLEVLTTIFPSLKKIYFDNLDTENNAIFRDGLIYEHVLSFLAHSPYISLKMVVIVLPNSIEIKAATISMIQWLDSRFKKLDWMIYTEKKFQKTLVVMRSVKYSDRTIEGIPKKYKKRIVQPIVRRHVSDYEFVRKYMNAQAEK